jgi:glycosyltransferase involved in cell wall biosynthesis
MKVSVLMLAYNHERFIEQAIASVLEQQTDFDYEILIGEDGSSDATGRIVRQLQAAHPEKVRAILRETNIGMQRNFIETYRACRGQYVAFLDGDDFWTSPAKLQKQVDFLDRRPDYALCFHNALTLSEIADRPECLVVPADVTALTFELHDILIGNPIPSCSLVVRNGLIAKFPEWVDRIQGIDWIFGVLNAQYGKIGYLPECLARYRVHEGGAWSMRPMRERTEVLLEIYRGFLETLDNKYHRLIKTMLHYEGSYACLNSEGLQAEHQRVRQAYDDLASEYHRTVDGYHELHREYDRTLEAYQGLQREHERVLRAHAEEARLGRVA